MLPTLAVILWAYGMYALFSFIIQRHRDHHRSRSRGRTLYGLALAGGVVGLGLILWCCLTPDKGDQRLRLAGFLGTVYAEGPDRVDRVEFPAVKGQNQGAEEQPAYALLHPETPANQIEPEKKLVRPRPSRAVKKPQTPGVQEKFGKTGKVAKAAAPLSKKDKLAAKSRAKKKKRPSGPENRQANAG